ncbi:MAG: replicative DNA helicase [Candidatus Eisenbacteria bacterium]|uniref:Replicative DNA helicase n=1 Tax=Eiseniibacteriota bacterium TaxID=2212470 RepID=A0A849SXC9_UNCEI|nr:replicative DNA helicase [Candidatus Eisenbacteria bacterium]
MTDMLSRSLSGLSEGPVPPQSLDAERAVLSACLLGAEAIGRAVEKIDSSVFYRPAHQKIFDACISLYNRNERADLITVTEELRMRGELESAGGPAALAQLLESATTTANVEEHVRIVASKAVLRQLIRASQEIQGECFSGSDETQNILDRSEQKIFAITDSRVRQGFVTLKDLLKPTFKHIQELYERKVFVTGVPSGYDDLDKMTAGFQAGDLIIIAGRPAMGKCLAAHTLIDDPDTGARVTLEECVRRQMTRVMGIDDRGRVRAAPISAWVDSGEQPTYRVITRTGREVEVTGHHPFLTVHGWQPLHDLPVGSKIAVARSLPVFGSDESWSLERVRLLAYFIAEGGLTSRCPNFTNTDPVIVSDFHECIEREFPSTHTRLQDSRGITWRVSRKRNWPEEIADRVHPVTDWLDKLGLMGKKSDSKSFPAEVWCWSRERLVEFLKTLFSCDGTICSMWGDPRIEFTVASRSLAFDVQHALCRLGVVAKLWRKTDRSWRVEITEPASVDCYQHEVGWIGEKATRFSDASPARLPVRARHSNVGHPSADAWELVSAAASRSGVTITELASRAGEALKRGHNLHRNRGITRTRLTAFAEASGDPDLGRAASPDLYWDEILSIEPAGTQQVYDLSVPDGANFVAADVCVHNTSLAVNMGENAAIRHKVPVAIFSLEMSKEQLAMRLLCSQSEVALHKVRSGFLGHEDWPRLTTGAGLLSQAPIMIDDSASPTILEIRAKCRRLKAENRLGLVLIDYLQLVRSAGAAENRVQEISQITRGLKALAKELAVPIIALSQLSRAVDSRAGNERRPQLSDLRESGSIEQDSDLVMFVFREEYYKRDDPSLRGKAELIVAKQRNGPTGEIDMTFLHEFTKFVPGSNLMPGETEPGF